jgi:hypothetical protein
MKKILASLSMALFATLAPTMAAHADPAAPSAASRSPSLDLATAPIRTAAQLQEYVANNQSATNPFASLSPRAREHFLASLHFGPDGLGSYSALALEEELSLSQAYKLLALFGLQSDIAVIHGLAVYTADDVLLDAWRRDGVEPDAKENHYCNINGKCAYAAGMICHSRTC